ncbi:uncharacterized protein LOC125235205 [Leguminivora glycinivorella]|uniref:uncharacterized protein LOC125235205 n=1 Tax=Leguminivora glycinivorella TaxID=1035111 RepID=UPI00200FBB0B|nr:uncharacterized protein LOC125235205 [Leguminivora glycinivorella]XP_047997639.1 uncharacterized protein LOC125235205 [Leguminivora glycinivorella]
MLPYLILVFALQPALNLPQKDFDIKRDLRKKKGINIAYPLPLTHHLLLPSQLHVLPATSNVHHSSVHTGVQHIVTSGGNIPVYSQTVSHSSTNITHPTQLVPILVPIQHNFVTPQHTVQQQHNLIQQQLLHDLSVIPLRAQKFGHLRVENKAEDREDMNRFRTFYGGFGNGLYFGGHGTGHGFYAYGK